MKALPKLSPPMLDAFNRMADDGLRLVRRQGGYWTTPSVPVSRRGVPDWYVPTQTMHALESRGVIRATREDPANWRADRVIHEDYLLLAAQVKEERAAAASSSGARS